jgi:hypothetical protein
MNERKSEHAALVAPSATVSRLLGQALSRLDRDESRPPLFFATQSCALVGQGIKLAALDFDHPLLRPIVESALAFADRGLRDRPARSGTDVLDAQDTLGRAQCWHARAMGEALLANAAIELSALEMAHAHYLEFLKQARSMMEKERYLAQVQGGAELCLSAGRTELAGQLLEIAPPFQPCPNRHMILTEVLATVRKYREKPGSRTGGFMLGSVLGKVGLGSKTPPGDSCVIPEGETGRFMLAALFFLWRTGKGAEWVAHIDTLDRVRPEPNQSLSLAALALMEDRFILGHAVPDWRRTMRRLSV